MSIHRAILRNTARAAVAANRRRRAAERARRRRLNDTLTHKMSFRWAWQALQRRARKYHEDHDGERELFAPGNCNAPLRRNRWKSTVRLRRARRRIEYFGAIDYGCTGGAA